MMKDGCEGSYARVRSSLLVLRDEDHHEDADQQGGDLPQALLKG
jgi:hypothetical protein